MNKYDINHFNYFNCFFVVVLFYNLFYLNHNNSGDLAKLPLYLWLSYSAGWGISQGYIFHISLAYSLIVLSELNHPLRTEFRNYFFAHYFLSLNFDNLRIGYILSIICVGMSYSLPDTRYYTPGHAVKSTGSLNKEKLDEDNIEI